MIDNGAPLLQPSMGESILSGGMYSEEGTEDLEDDYDNPDGVGGQYEAIELPLKPKVSKTLSLELGIEKGSSRSEILDAVGVKIFDLVKEASEQRADRDGRINKQLDALQLLAPGRRSPLGPDGANIRTSPMFTAFCSLHGYLLQAVTGITPVLQMLPLGSGDNTPAKKQESYYDPYYQHEVGVRNLYDKGLEDAIKCGFSAFKVVWEYKKKKVFRVVQLTPSNAKEHGYTLPANYTENQVVRGKKGKAKLGDYVQSQTSEVVLDRPNIVVVPYFSFVVSPADCDDVELAVLVGDRKKETLSFIAQQSHCGVYDEEASERVIESAQRLTGGILTHILNAEAVDTGIKEEDLQPNEISPIKSGDEVELFHGIVSLDLDGDEISEDWMVSFETSTKTVLHLRPYNMSTTLRPYRPIVPNSVRAGLYSMSIGDLMEGVQDQMDSTVNLALDYAALSATFIVEEQSSATKKLPKVLRPGMNKVETNEPNSVNVIPLVSRDSQNNLPAIPMIEKQGQDISAISETMAGQLSRTSETTATETKQASMAGSRRLEVQVSRVQKPLVECHAIIHEMLITHNALELGNPEGEIAHVYKTYNGGTPSGMTLAEFASPTVAKAQGSTVNTDQALKLQAAEKVFLMSSQSPLIAGSNAHTWMATKFFLDAYDIKNVEDYIGTLQEAKQKDQAQAEQAQQNPTPENVPPKLDDFSFALLLQANPQLADQLIQSYTAVMQAQAQGQAAKQVNQQQAEIEKAGMDAELDAGKQKLEIEKAKMALEGQIMKLEQKKQEIGNQLAAGQMEHESNMMQMDQAATSLSHEHAMASSGLENKQAEGEMKAKGEALKLKQAQQKQQAQKKATK